MYTFAGTAKQSPFRTQRVHKYNTRYQHMIWICVTTVHCAPLSLHLNMVRGDFEVKREQLHAPPARALAGGCLRARRPTLATTRAQSAGLVKALVKMSANCFSVSTPAILR